MIKKILVFCICFVLSITSVMFFEVPQKAEFFYNSQVLAVAPKEKLGDKIVKVIKKLFFGSEKETEAEVSKVYEEVFLGGNAIGFSINSNGVIIVGESGVDDGTMLHFPCKDSGVSSGDILTHIEDKVIDCGEKIGEIINSPEYINKKVKLTINRNNNIFNVYVLPAFDNFSGKNKLGLWVRDNSSGVGTLTYVKADGSFSALGHAVTDIDTATILPVKSGNLYKCSIIGTKMGQRGIPGEIKGLFSKKNNSIATIEENTKFGLKGKFEQNSIQNYSTNKIKLAYHEEVKPGKASLFCCIDGTEVKSYEIEIIKTNIQSSSKDKSMIVRVVDSSLLDYTGGIVQGMSGSPIVQNGKLVGALTHVFVSDPTKGYAIYSEWL